MPTQESKCHTSTIRRNTLAPSWALVLVLVRVRVWERALVLVRALAREPRWEREPSRVLDLQVE